MDYDALAKQYGGADAAPVIDYDALAKQYGGADMPASTGIPTARRAPGAMAQLGRSAASLADVTLGGVIPAITQQVAYPLARLGRSPAEAQAATQRIVGAVDQPFGKAFGVSETPEYKQEAGRQIMDFIGQNFQKGAKWISERTGIPASDVENMIGTATVAAPKVVPPLAREAVRAGKQVAENVSLAAKMPFEKQIQAKRERLSLEDYARGPQIEAAAEAQRLKIALNPADIEPSATSRAYSAIAGPRGPEALTEVNRPRVAEIAKNEMGLPPTTQLNGRAAFNQARAQVAAPYEQIKKLPIQQADDAMIKRFEDIRTDLDVIGAKEYAPAISKIVDDAIAKTQTGLTGEALLKNISVLRERARKTYNNKAATTEALDIADTNLKIATELESMIDNSIFNPKLLGEYRDARQKMARTYAYEGATDFNTGMVDVSKLARITSKDNGLSGDIASLGKIAGNFPDAFSTAAASKFYDLPRLSRSGLAGSMGALAGSYFGGTPGLIIGGLASSGVGELAGAGAARRMASPGYQSGLNLRDMRLPVNQLAASMQPIPQNRAVVPYEAPVEVLAPGEGPYQPNFVFGRPEAQITPSAPNMMRALPAPGSPLNALRAEDVRAGQMSRTLGQQAEAQQAAAEAAARRPTSGAVELQINPLTGVPEIATGVKGATPAVIEGANKAAVTAAEKMRTGRAFDMTAAEKIQWSKSLLEGLTIAQGEAVFGKLTPQQITTKMADRAFAENAITKARQQAQAFEDIAARAANERMRQDALIKREQMMDLVEQLQDTLGARPVKRGGQGPKTRAFQRNALAPEQEIQNALVNEPFRMEIRGTGKK